MLHLEVPSQRYMGSEEEVIALKDLKGPQNFFPGEVWENLLSQHRDYTAFS